MRRRSRKQASPYLSPSPEQLAEISTRQRNIRRLGVQVNRPWSMLASILFTYPALSILFLQEWSPLRWAYNETFESYQTGYYQDITGMLPSYTPIDEHPTTLVFNGLITNLKKVGNEVLSHILKGFNDPENIQDIVKAMDLLNSNDHFIAEYPHLVEPFKKPRSTLIVLHQKLCEFLKGYSSQEKCDIDINSKNLTELFNVVEPLYGDFKTAHSAAENKANEFAEEKTHITFNHFLFLTNIVVAILAQYSIIDFMLSRYRPGGIWQTPAPSPRSFLTQHETSEYNQQLQPIEDTLTKKSKRNIALARYASPLFSMLAMYMIIISSNSSIDFAVIAFSCLATAMIDWRNDANEVYKARTFQSQLSKQEHYIKNALGDLKHSIQTNKHNTLETSDFIIQFESKKYDDDIVSGKKIARFFKNCCLHHGITVIYQINNRVAIPAQSSLTQKEIATIRAALKANISDELEARRTTTPSTTYDPHQLSELFNHSSYAEAGKTRPKKRNGKRRPSASHHADAGAGASASAGAGAGAGAESEVNDDQPQTHRVVRFPSGAYDSNNNEQDVFPLVGGKHDKHALNTARLFVTSRIDWDKVPRDIADGLQAKLDKQVQAPKLVRSKGAQGFMLWNNQERDQDNRWFQAAVKLKFKGKHGDVRAYAEAEKSGDGNTLFVIRGLKLKSH